MILSFRNIICNNFVPNGTCSFVFLGNSYLKCSQLQVQLVISEELIIIERGEKTPTSKISALLRKRPVLLRPNFVLTKDRKRPYYGHFCGKLHREGSLVNRPGVLSKVHMLNLVLGVGVFSLLPIVFNPVWGSHTGRNRYMTKLRGNYKCIEFCRDGKFRLPKGGLSGPMLRDVAIALLWYTLSCDTSQPAQQPPNRVRYSTSVCIVYTDMWATAFLIEQVKKHSGATFLENPNLLK